MEVIKSKWKRTVEYGDKGEFKFWSPKVKGKGDETLEKRTSLEKWTKVIVFMPEGSPDTIFSMGFSSVFGDTIVSDAARRIEEGPFGMRMGPEDCEFFIVSNQGEVELDFVRYAHIDKPGVDLY